MGLDRVTTTTSGSPTAQHLLDFFVEKIEAIRRSTGGSPATTNLHPATSAFDGFQKLSVDEVYRFIASSKSKVVLSRSNANERTQRMFGRTATVHNCYVQ